jgi:hypothetical protein
MSAETLEIIVPKTPATLSFLALHMQEKIKCIELGHSFLITGNKIAQGWNNEKLGQRIKNLQMEVEHEKQKRDKIMKVHAEEKKHLVDTIRSTEGARYTAELNHRSDKIFSLERKLDEEMDKYRTLYQKLMSDFDQRSRDKERKNEERIKYLEDRLETERKANENLSMRGQNSTYLGQDGEQLTKEALNCLFPTAEIIDTHAQGGKGDFVLKESNMCCLIETKNHKTNVGRGDIDKFYDDIEHNADIQCGIFASLKSGVVNRGDFHLEFRNKKPILFLTRVKDNMKHIKIALMLFRLLLSIDHLNMSEKEKIDRVTHIVPVIKRKWTSMRTTLATFHTTMNQLINEQEGSIKELFSL